MKKIISTLMIIAAAAISFSSCQKQEMIAPEASQEVTLTFSSEKPAFADETKTEWTGTTIQWSNDDKIRVAYTAGDVWQNAAGNAKADEVNGSKTAKIYASNSVEAGEIASFSVPGNFTIPTGVDLEFYGVYPSTASGVDMPYAPSVTVTIPAEQKPLEGSFDSKADLMAARSVSTYILSEENPLPEAIPLMWTRLVAHGHFTINNLAVAGEEDIKSIVLTANDEADMVGQHYLYLDTYNVEKPSGNSAPNKLTIDATNLTIANGSVSFWACFLPCTWTSVAVQVETDKATYTREIDLTANQKTFAKNARNILSINMATATRDEKEVSVGTLPFVKDFSEMTGNNELTELDGFSELSKVYNNTSSIRLATTSAAGLLETNPLNLSQNFHVIVTARGWAVDEMLMTVSAGEQEHNVDLTTYGTNGGFVEYVMNFTPVGESATVSFTAAADKRYYIQKIQVLEGHAELPSILTVTAPEQMSAEGGNGSFSYTLTNPKDGLKLTVSEDADWITDVEAAEGTVTYTVEANITEDPREAVITLTYGDLTETVKVSQKGQAAAGAAYYEKVTSAPAEADWSGTYLMVYENDKKVLSAISTTSTKYGIGVDVEIENNCILASSVEESYQIVITKATVTSGAYVLAFDGGKLYWTSGNSLATNSTESANTNWTLSVSEENVTIVNCKDNTRVIKWNASSPRFACYTSGQQAIQLYKLVGGEGGVETPEPELQERNLAFSLTTATATVGEDFTEPTLTGATDGVTYSSSNTSVATVNESTGEVTLVAKGETTITATAAADATYKAGAASYALTVSAGSQGGETSKTWKLVTDASTLTAGDKLAIVSSSKGKVAGSLTSQYLASIAVTITGNAFSTLPSGAVEFTLGGASGAWTLAGSDGKLLGATAVKKLAWGSGTTTWSISIEDNGDATIQNGTSSYGRFLYNNSSPRFTTYTSETNSGMLLPQIYRYE